MTMNFQQLFAGRLFRDQVIIFFTLFLSFAFFYNTGQHNENARYDQIRSVVDDGTWNIDRYSYNTADIITIKGRYYPVKGPGSTFLGMPIWYATKVLLSPFRVSTTTQHHLACYFVSLFTCGLATAIVGVLLYSVLIHTGSSAVLAAMLSLFYGLGTIAFWLSTTFFTHQIATGCLFLGFYLLWRQKRLSREFPLEPQPNRHFILAGIPLGYSIVVEYPSAVAVILIGIYALSSFNARKVLMLIAGGVLGILPLFLYNWSAFGDPLFIGYSALGTKENPAFQAMQSGVVGIGFPSWNSLLGISFQKQRGLFYINPWLLLFLPGSIMAWRKGDYPAEVTLAFGLVVATFAVNAGYGDSIVYWGGGASLGPRHLGPALPFMTLLSSFALRSLGSQIVLLALGGYSVFVMTLASAIEPRLPYEVVDPLDYILWYYRLGRFAISTQGVFSQVPLFTTAGSFNAGKIFGLPAKAELFPVVVLWITLLPTLFHPSLNSLKRIGGIYKFLGFGAQGVLSAALLFFAAFPVLSKSQLPACPTGSERGLIGTYFSGLVWKEDARRLPPQVPLEEARIRHLDREINFQWDIDNTPLISPFTAIWSGKVFAPWSGLYHFGTTSDDGSAIFIDGVKIVDNWKDQAATQKAAPVALKQGYHNILLVYYNLHHGGTVQLSWAPPGIGWNVVPADMLCTQ